MSRLHPLLAILQLFENGRPVWAVEDIGAALKMPTSTTYRHVRGLVQAGFLDPVTGAGYALGPGFIRYDRILRQNDQLIRVADPVMKELLAQIGQRATVILCRQFRDCVMCVHDVDGAKPHPTTSYERGVAMPMFLGATSKVILANLPDRTLKRVYLANEAVIRRVLKVRDWNGFKEQLRTIKRAGYALTESEVAKGRIGLAVPISRGDQVVAGITLVPQLKDRAKVTPYIPMVIAAAAKISKSLSKQQPVISR
jgi:DNA-binding IclR family transcriptional regulator